MIPLIYIAGRYRAPTVDLIKLNISTARDVAIQADALGWYALCPHMNSALLDQALPDLSDDYWLMGTMAMMERCDALVLVPGWQQSAGTLAELARARQLGMPIYMSPDVLPSAERFLKGNTLQLSARRLIESSIDARRAADDVHA